MPAVNRQEIFTSEAGGKKTDNKERKRVEPSVKELKNESSVGLMADEEIDKFIRKQRSQQTVYKDRTETNRLKKFCESVGENREQENIPPVELNKILCSFFMTAKRKDGKEYEPGSLASFQNTLQRILVDRGSKINIKTDTEFEKSRKVLASKRKELTSNGYGNHPNAARVLEQEEIDELYRKGFFGIASPLALQRALWWITLLHFGCRARDEAKKMKWGDIKLVKDPEGVEMLMWNTERGTKTRTGEKAQAGQRKFPPMAVATGTDRCPVKLYKAFASRRPDSMKLAGSPFFLQVKTKGWEESQVWYYPTPWGKNKIGEILTKARSVIGLETSTGKVSNHSVRKTGIHVFLTTTFLQHL